MGTKILYDEGIATVDPLGPDNKLVYITGPMTGTPSPSSGRYMVCTKSPLTGMIACSNSGGIWGAKLKHAGWDGLIVEGVAKEWTYLLVDDGEISFHSAEQYVGMKSEDMDEALRKVHREDLIPLLAPAALRGQKKTVQPVLAPRQTTRKGNTPRNPVAVPWNKHKQGEKSWQKPAVSAKRKKR